MFKVFKKPNKEERLWNSDEIQEALRFIKDQKEYVEKAFNGYVEDHTNFADARAIANCINACWYEQFQKYDSDVCEQFIDYIEATIMKKSWLESTARRFAEKECDNIAKDSDIETVLTAIDAYYKKVNSPYIKVNVHLEGNGRTYEALVNEMRVNKKYVIPYFNKKVGTQIAKDFPEEEISYDSFHEAFVSRKEWGKSKWYCSARVKGETKRYPIGNREWKWLIAG